MKYEEPLKITALSVVIFSFISLLLGTAIYLMIDAIAALLVLNTNLEESSLKIGSVLASGVAILISSIFLTLKTKIKGIYAATIISSIVILIKIIGNASMDLGGYFSLNGLIGILFTILFSIIGGMIGANLKQ